MVKTLMTIMTASLLMVLNSEPASAKSLERDNVKTEDTWNLTDIYPSDEAWEAAKNDLAEKIQKIPEFRGTLATSPEDLLNCLKTNSELLKTYIRLSSYASMKNDQDTRIAKYSAMEKEIAKVGTDYSTMASFIEPEILEINPETLAGFIANNKGLQDYKMYLGDLQRTRAHTLSEKEEKIVAQAGLMSGSASSIFSTFINAELPYPDVTLSNGDTVTLDLSGYNLYRALPNRDDRKKVYDSFWSALGKFQLTLGEDLYANLKKDIFYANVRNYDNTLEAALDRNNIDTDVYMSLVDNVNSNLETFQRYLKLKQRMLGVDTLYYYDLYAPCVGSVDLDYSLDEAKELVLKSLKPMGREYVKTVKKAFDDRWIDFPATAGKRSGAYSNGSIVDVHPYILTNFNGKYNDVSTIAHELGHSMHSYFSNKTQPYPMADYSIFVAEVASTLNEALLMNTVLKDVKNDDVKLALLMNYLDGVKGTFWRQTQFAEFELKTHLMAEKGQALTGESFTELYKEIVRKYYGHDKGVCIIPDECNLEWSYIPHFYYNYYVYQYATSFTASTALSEKIINNEKGAVENVMKFLSAGGSDYPINVLKDAGIDMLSSEPFDQTMCAMNRAMDEIEKILDSRGK